MTSPRLGPRQGFVFAIAADDVPPGTSHVVELAGQKVVIYRIDEQFYASSNLCPHASGPMGEGDIEGHQVTCPYHGWTFDIPTGRCTNIDNARLVTYPVQQRGGDVLVKLG